MNTLVTGAPRDTATSQLLQKTGMSSETANFVDTGLSLAGGIGGAACLRQSGQIGSAALKAPQSMMTSVQGGQQITKSSTQIGRIVNQSTNSCKGAYGIAGRRGFEMKNFYKNTSRNKPGIVYGRSYTSHAFDQMENRGIMPSIIEETIQKNSCRLGKEPGTISYYDKVNNVTIIINEEGKVVTTSFGDIKQ